MTKSVAVVFTCHNRIHKTQKCIDGLLCQRTNYDIQMDYYICDDKSSDGTQEMIKKSIPNANIINGNGNLFWCKGMYYAMQKAVSVHHDFYLMINDDLVMKDDMIQIMLDSYYQIGRSCGIVGPTLSLDGKEATYGGKKYRNGKNYGKADYVFPDSENRLCDIANWNCFLIDNEVIDNVGIIDKRYQHAYGDYDYCLSMRRKKIPIYVANRFIGFTDSNSKKGTSKDSTLKKFERIKKLFSIKEKPIKSQLHFYIKNYNVAGIIMFFRTYLLSIFQIFKNN